MDVKKLCSSNERCFYPTPPELARKMLQQIDFNIVSKVLEPSAGKGDLAEEILTHMNSRSSLWDIDLVEIDPNLRGILMHRFTEEGIAEYHSELFDEYEQLQKQGVKNRMERYSYLHDKIQQYDNTDHVHVVHDDFLTYFPKDGYDAIIMNPPFINGSQHLLHAIQMIRHYGGQIVCLLNAETLRNPYSQERKILIQELNRYGAVITYHKEAFVTAERPTEIDIAMVYIKIDMEKPTSSIFEKLEKAEQKRFSEDKDYAELVSADPIEAAIIMYNMEVEASLALMDEYNAMKRYLSNKFDQSNDISISLSVSRGGRHVDIITPKKLVHEIRLKYWRMLLSNKQFVGLLTSQLQNKYYDMVDELADYEFSRYNIERMRVEMMAELVSGAKDCIMELFEKLSAKHSYSDYIQNGNIHYYNGWKTNKAYKIGKKVIIPTYGLYSEWNNEFKLSAVYSLLSDIEKALNYLDGGLTQEVNLLETLEEKLKLWKSEKISLKYFDIKLYKKGTLHITFREEQLIDRLNIFAGQKKRMASSILW